MGWLQRKMALVIKQLFPDEWRVLAENAHLIMFGESRPASMDRIDYALIAEEDGIPCGYLTAKELDAEGVYWQFGGAFPGTQGTGKSALVYEKMLEWTFERYKRITTLVENTNVRYLKFAMHFGFRIIGCRMFDGIVLVELLNKQEGN